VNPGSNTGCDPIVPTPSAACGIGSHDDEHRRRENHELQDRHRHRLHAAVRTDEGLGEPPAQHRRDDPDEKRQAPRRLRPPDAQAPRTGNHPCQDHGQGQSREVHDRRPRVHAQRPPGRSPAEHRIQASLTRLALPSGVPGSTGSTPRYRSWCERLRQRARLSRSRRDPRLSQPNLDEPCTNASRNPRATSDGGVTSSSGGSADVWEGGSGDRDAGALATHHQPSRHRANPPDPAD